MNDEKIIDLFWKRDETAIEQTVNQYGRYCWKIAYNVLGVEEDVQECLNDTWLGAWNSIPPARPACLSAFPAASSSAWRLLALSSSSRTCWEITSAGRA